jgi:REP element-mobilizing transposase RayT
MRANDNGRQRQAKAAKRRKNTAHGASSGRHPKNSSASKGRKNMGHTATNVLVHFIFSTHNRLPSITPDIESDLHAYIGGIIREIGGVALCINGMPDHVHLLVRLPPTRSVADVARLIKTNSSRWVHERWSDRKTFAWQTGYGAFSVSESGQNDVRAYILHQQEHHKKRSFKEEIVAFLKKNHITADDRFLWT